MTRTTYDFEEILELGRLIYRKLSEHEGHGISVETLPDTGALVVACHSCEDRLLVVPRPGRGLSRAEAEAIQRGD